MFIMISQFSTYGVRVKIQTWHLSVPTQPVISEVSRRDRCSPTGGHWNFSLHRRPDFHFPLMLRHSPRMLTSSNFLLRLGGEANKIHISIPFFHWEERGAGKTHISTSFSLYSLISLYLNNDFLATLSFHTWALHLDLDDLHGNTFPSFLAICFSWTIIHPGSIKNRAPLWFHTRF